MSWTTYRYSFYKKKNTSLCPIFVDLTLSLCEASIVFCRLHVPGSPCSGATAPSPQIAPRFIQGPSSQTMRMKLLEFFRIPSWWSAALKSHPGGEPGPGSISWLPGGWWHCTRPRNQKCPILMLGVWFDCGAQQCPKGAHCAGCTLLCRSARDCLNMWDTALLRC